MKKNLTELVYILDKSGSMQGLEKDTIGGYNAMLAQQRTVEGDCVITTVLFDNQYQLLHDRIDIRAVRPLTQREYFVGGSTALLDAIGKTIDKIHTAQKNTAEDYRAERVLFVIITDGAEPEVFCNAGQKDDPAAEGTIWLGVHFPGGKHGCRGDCRPVRDRCGPGCGLRAGWGRHGVEFPHDE